MSEAAKMLDPHQIDEAMASMRAYFQNGINEKDEFGAAARGMLAFYEPLSRWRISEFEHNTSAETLTNAIEIIVANFLASHLKSLDLPPEELSKLLGLILGSIFMRTAARMETADSEGRISLPVLKGGVA